MDDATTGDGASTTRALTDPRLLPFLPALYLAWSDGELTRAETRALCGLIDASEGLDASCRELLGGWLDPERPPSAVELVELHGAIRRAGRTLEPADSRSLPELAAALAAAHGRPLSPPEVQALLALESAFGLTGAEVGRGLLATERPQPAAVLEPGALPAGDLARWLDGPERATRERVRRLLAQPAFAPPLEASRHELREWTLAACRLLAEHGLGALSFPPAFGGRGDAAGFIAAFETVAFHDLSLLVKFGVQFGLFGGSIRELGTERHHESCSAVGTLELPGCFAMTETGHGSNVRDLRDRGALRAARPTSSSSTLRVRRRARTTSATLRCTGASPPSSPSSRSARSTTGSTPFSCRSVKRTARSLRRASAIEDCGEKLGLNGIDNGRLWFDQVRSRARTFSIASRRSLPTARTEPDRESGQAILHDAGDPRRWSRERGARRRLSTAKSALTIAVTLRRCAAGSSDRMVRPKRCCSTTALTSGGLLPRLATTYALDFALRASGGRVRRLIGREADREVGVPGGWTQGARHLARDGHDPGLP